MDLDIKYNKSALNELRQQLKMREMALPTLKSKEAALRLEVKKAKEQAQAYDAELKQRIHSITDMLRLWSEFDVGLVKLKDASLIIEKR